VISVAGFRRGVFAVNNGITSGSQKGELVSASRNPEGAGTLGRLSHAAVLVRDLSAAVEKYESLFGAALVEQETLANGTDVAVVELGGLHLEFLSTRQPESKVAKLLDELGEGIHHLSFEVADLDAAMERLKASGVRLRDRVPRPGLHGRRIVFIEPEDTFGVLIELVDEAR
jgi:methylmalonyl-CoA/ethylmalonyl-CoA epimerase